MENYSFGTCEVCGQGLLMAVKNIINGEMLIMCDDCESQWKTPDEAQSYENALLEETRTIVPASAEDIEVAGWEKYLNIDARS